MVPTPHGWRCRRHHTNKYQSLTASHNWTPNHRPPSVHSAFLHVLEIIESLVRESAETAWSRCLVPVLVPGLLVFSCGFIPSLWSHFRKWLSAFTLSSWFSGPGPSKLPYYLANYLPSQPEDLSHCTHIFSGASETSQISIGSLLSHLPLLSLKPVCFIHYHSLHLMS